MAADGFDVRLLYRAHNEGDIVFKKEIDALAAEHGVRVDYLLTQAGSRRLSRDAWLSPATLAGLSQTSRNAWSTSVDQSG
jgi:NAD(P)H-flavin reductase